jgi:hypothetical protein
VGQAQFGGGQCLKRGARQEQEKGWGLRAYVEVEGTDGRYSEAVERGDQRVGHIAVGELDLRAGLQVIFAYFIVFTSLS